MSTKKVFVELVQYLEANKDKKVSSLLKTVKEMTSTKKSNQTVIYKDNKPYAIYCYYHKQWELVKDVPFGSKKSNKSGLNNMCKVGTNQWTKQQAEAKKAKAKLLDDVTNGKIDPKDLKVLLDQIEEQRNRIDMKDAPKGTKEAPQL